MGKSSRMVDFPLPHLIAGGYIHYPANLAPQQRDSQCSPRFSTCWLYESIQTPILYIFQVETSPNSIGEDRFRSVG